MKNSLCALLLTLITFSGHSLASLSYAQETKTAYFAGGCFWCVEADFEKHAGVSEVISGYTGGDLENPTYKQVSSDKTGHREAVEVQYDPSIISYQELLDIFWRIHDPTDATGSFVDRGFHYTSAIYYSSEEERILAEGAKAALDASGKFKNPVSTEIAAFKTFYLAEDYHQNYYLTNKQRYEFYRAGSGRNNFIEKFWANDDTVYQLPENLTGN